MQPLPPAIARLETLIAAGAGDFVAGAALAEGIGIPVASLPSFIAELRRRKPDLVIEGKRGRGYRLVTLACSPPPPTAVKVEAGTKRPLPLAARASALDLFIPALAEIVRDIAFASGETIDATVARLVAYGAEVHRDLVMDGENPLGLCRLAAHQRPPPRRPSPVKPMAGQACQPRYAGTHPAAGIT